jgi:tRNA (guanine-N7-)-methyltransferase
MAAMPTAAPISRDVVSFVRRGGRMNPSQQRAWDTHSDWIVTVPRLDRETSIAPDARVEWDALFGRSAPLMVELGSGTGDAITAAGLARPEANHVAIEVFLPAIGSTLSKLDRAGVGNVRVLLADGVQALGTIFEPGSITELSTWFPDPWPKARHQKRRLVNPAFAALVASRLVPGGLWRLATDAEDYALQMREVLDAEPALENVHEGWAPRPDLRPVTRFEQRALSAGRTVHDLEYRSSTALAQPDAPA